jgi:hypothetical protein
MMVVSCSKPGQEDTSTIFNAEEDFNKVSMSMVGTSGSLGEFLVNDPDQLIQIEVRNNSADFEVINLQVDFETDRQYFDYYPDLDQQKAYPGYGGTCKRILPAGGVCYIHLAFTPKRSGEYSFPFEITYTPANTEKVAKPFVVTARAGLPAELYLESGLSFTDHGIIEQTEGDKEYITEYTIKNSGELAAKEIDFLMASAGDETAPGPAFTIFDNLCTDSLEPLDSCSFKVKHRTWNNLATDPTTSYSLVLSIPYKKDNRGTNGGLTIQLASYSTLIQALMEVAGSATIEFSANVINGTQDTQVFKFTNNGYRSGIPRKLIFHKADTSFWAQCYDVAGEILCYDESFVPVTLADFPFTITDINSCFTLREVAGRTATTAGETCFIQMTYQPSQTRSASVDDSGATISLEYDRLWKGEETIFTDQLFVIQANSITPANLVLESLDFNNNPVSQQTVTNPEVDNYYFYLGRLAKVTSPNYPHSMIYKIKNTGDSPAYMVDYVDEATPINSLNTVPTDLNSYYRNVSVSGCDVILPNQTCTLSLNLTTLALNPGGASAEFSALNDTTTTNPEDCGNYINNSQDLLDNCHKTFTYTYTDSSQLNDDGSPVSNRSTTVNFSADLVAKAFLVYEDDEAAEADYSMVGESKTAFFNILNIGTGPATYMRLIPGRRLLDPNVTGTGYDQNFSYTINVDDMTGADYTAQGTDKDCKIINDWDSSNYFPGGGGSVIGIETLPAYESCSFKIVFSMHPSHRYQYYSDTPPANMTATDFTAESKRLVQREYSNTIDAWEIPEYNFRQEIQLQYADGDVNANPVDSNIFGNFDLLERVWVTHGWRSYGRIVPGSTTPSWTGFIKRMAFTLPALNTPNYIYEAPPNYNPSRPWDPVTSAINLPTQVFYNQGSSADYFSHLSFLATNLADNFETTAPYSTEFDWSNHDYVVNLGTYPAGLPYSFSPSFRISGSQGGARLTDVTYVAGTGSTQMTFDDPTPLINSLVSGESQLGLPFTVTDSSTAGLEFGSLNYEFESVDRTEDVDVQIMLELVDQADFPNLKLSVAEHNVEYDPLTDITSVTLMPSGWDTVDSPLSFLTYSAAHSHSEELSAVKDSEVYTLKRFQIKNDSIHTLNNLRIYLNTHELVVGNGASIPNDLSIYDSTCTSALIGANESLNPGATCFIDLKYEPMVTSISNTVNFIFMYEIKNEQFTSQMASLSLVPIDPAEVYVVDTNIATKRVDNNKPDIGGNPYTTDAWMISYNDYNHSTQAHIVLDAYPTIAHHAAIELANDSPLSASFLKGIDPLDWSSISFTPFTDGRSYTEIYDKVGLEGDPMIEKNMKIFVTAPCLWGDWNGDHTVDPIPETVGFNGNTPPSHPCFMRFEFHATEQYIGQNIVTEDYVATTYYYNNGFAAYSNNLNFAYEGFVQAPPSIADNGGVFENLYMESGTISVDWDTFTTTGDPAWGDIVGYRIYYDNNSGQLNMNNEDIYKDDVFTNYAEVDDTTFTLSRNLQHGRGYKYILMPIREMANGTTYLSPTDMETPLLLSPSNLHKYDHDIKTLFETSYFIYDFQKTKQDAIDTCSGQNFSILINGSNVGFPMQVISKAEYERVRAEPLEYNRYQNGNDNYVDGQYLLLPHYTRDATIDAHTIFDPHGWDGVSNTFSVGAPHDLELLIDADAPDTNVDIMVGGMFTSTDKTYYVSPTQEIGLVRCTVDISSQFGSP